MRLSELKTGDKAVIQKVLGHGGFRKRIIEMGFIKGKTVEVLLNAPLKDPVKYKIMGYDISLRREEARMIEVSTEVADTEKSNGLTTAGQPFTEKDTETKKAIHKGKKEEINVALVGNPNCGKTTLFNYASGAHERVGNYCGVTVEAKEGFFEYGNYKIKIVDLPGTYSLSAYTPEEIYVRKHIIEETPDIIINVIDSSNLERNLYLTTELIDMNVRMVVALNMYDELEHRGNKLDYKQLGKLLGVPAIPTVCRTGRGVDDLLRTVVETYESEFKEVQAYHHIHINNGPVIEKSIENLRAEIIKNRDIRAKYSARYLAIKLLENDKEIINTVEALPNAADIMSCLNAESEKIKEILKEDSESAITDAKYGFISGALKETFTENPIERKTMTKVIDTIVTNKYFGYPIFIAIMFIIFYLTFVLGNYPMEWIETGVGALSDLVKNRMADGPLKDMIADGIIGGVGGVIVFLPNILILYLCISVLEDTGYMARAAFIMDKIMHKIGLHGKSFIPLVMGFGCNVPAITATRTIENHKSRIITILITPFMSCSARIPIYVILIGTFFKGHEVITIMSLYAIGIVLAIIVAKIFSRILVKGNDTPFVMELPPYRVPTAKSVFSHTWEKGVQYLKKMGGIIMVASIIVWFLGYYPHNENLSPMEQQENSYIGQIGKAIEPAMQPLGFDWKMSVGLLSGIGAKEIVASTLGVLYNESDESDGDMTDIGSKMHISPLIAYCYMLFVLIYFPCIATFAAIKQETGKWRWAIFSAVYTTVLAWIICFVVYNMAALF